MFLDHLCDSCVLPLMLSSFVSTCVYYGYVDEFHPSYSGIVHRMLHSDIFVGSRILHSWLNKFSDSTKHYENLSAVSPHYDYETRNRATLHISTMIPEYHVFSKE